MLKLCSLVSLVLLLRGSSASALPEEDVPYIIEGQVITANEAPFQAVLLHNGLFICGGAIVAPLWIMTAAHCVDSDFRRPAAALSVRVGTDDANAAGEMDRTVDAVLVHPNKEGQTFLDYDVALLKLREPLRFSDRVRCIALAPIGPPPPAGTSISITGYGRTRPGEIEPPLDTRLRTIEMNVFDQDECRSRYADSVLVITARMFCAIPTGRSPCHYDSGGPVVHAGQLLGLVSGGGNVCADGFHPPVYALLPVMRDWIDDMLVINSASNPADGQCN